jgi:hypothetical protein
MPKRSDPAPRGLTILTALDAVAARYGSTTKTFFRTQRLHFRFKLLPIAKIVKRLKGLVAWIVQLFAGDGKARSGEVKKHEFSP